MSEVQPDLLSKIDLVLEEACRELPHGGSHEERRHVAEILLAAARSGRSTLGELGIIARKAVAEIKPGSANPA